MRDAAQLAWVVNLGCIDLNPHPVRADDLDHPDELRVDLDPMPGRRVAADRRGRAGASRGLEDFGLTAWPKTSRLAGVPRLRAGRAALDVPGGAARRAGAGPRGRTARAGPRHQQVVEGGTPRRVPRLQPEREGPHRRVAVLGPADAGRAGVGAAAVGRGSGVRPGGVHRGDDAGAVRERRRPVRGDRRGRRVAGRAARAVASSTRRPGSATRRGRRSTRSRRASRPASSRRSARPAARTRRRRGRGAAARAGEVGRPDRPAPDDQAADRDRPRARRRPRRWRASSGGRRSTPRRPPRCSRPTCWSTRCAAGARRGTRIRVNLEHVPEDRAPRTGGARGRLRPVGGIHRAPAAPLSSRSRAWNQGPRPSGRIVPPALDVSMVRDIS